MKHILPIILAALAAQSSWSQQIMSQNVDSSTVLAGNSIGCFQGATHWDNGYARSYAMDEFRGNQEIRIVRIDFGVEDATAAPLQGGMQPLEIRFYADTFASQPGEIANFPFLIPLATESFMLADQALTIESHTLSTPLDFTNDGSARLVVEVFSPSAVAVGHRFVVGSNAAGESNDSFLRAPACGLIFHVPLSLVGFASMNIVQMVHYEVFQGTGEDFDLNFSLNGGAESEEIHAVNVGDVLGLELISNGGAFDGSVLFVLGELYGTAAGPPASPFPGVHVTGTIGNTFILHGGAVPPTGAFCVLPPGGYRISFPYNNAVVAGITVLFQGIANNAMALNGFFASTNGHACEFN